MPLLWRVLVGAFAGVFACTLAVEAQSGRVLTHSQIADRDRPGTVLIGAKWTVKAEVGQEVIDVRGLIRYVNSQVENQLIPDRRNAKTRAIFEELLRHPTNYLAAVDPPVELTLRAMWTGSGFIVTPDGYVLTNAHVVSKTKEELKQAVIGDAGNNGLRELIERDFQNLQRAFKGSPAVDEQAIADRQQDFINAEIQYYGAHLQITNVKADYFAEMGVAVPGLNVMAKSIPCELRKQGETTPGKDVAVLKIEQTNLPTVPVGDDAQLRVGDSIVVIGYPGAADLSSLNSDKAGEVESTLTQGELSARKPMPGGWSALQTSAEINHGNSGGPAFNDRGEAIGLATFTPSEQGVRGINFLVPMSVAKEFLNELGVKTTQSRLTELYWSALDDMDKGSYKEALAHFQEVSDLSPGFPFIRDKIAQCRNSIDHGLDRGVFGNRNYLVGGVATLLILVTIVWFLVRRSSARALATPGAPRVSGPAANLPSREPIQTMVAAQAQAAPPIQTPVVLPPAKSFGAVQVTSGGNGNRRYEVTKQGILIGRDPAHCQIVLDEDSVSKEHAWIVPVDEGTVVIDRGSTNGTHVNSPTSPKVSKVRLQHGDRIFIGKSSAVLTYFSS